MEVVDPARTIVPVATVVVTEVLIPLVPVDSILAGSSVVIEEVGVAAGEVAVWAPVVVEVEVAPLVKVVVPRFPARRGS